jgi:hypothetical protein
MTEEYKQYTERKDVQEITQELGNVKSFVELTKWLANSMRTSPYLDWPRYTGSLGEDSTGGTRLADYIALNDRNILTIGSQEGHCDLAADADAELNAQNFLDYVEKITSRRIALEDITSIVEEQISYLECMLHINHIRDLIPLVMNPDSDLTMYILSHPQLAEAYAYKAERMSGRLQPMAGFPILTTTLLTLKSGEVVHFPHPLGTEFPTSAPIITSGLVGQADIDKLSNYKRRLLDDFAEWHSKTEPHVYIHPSLLFHLSAGPFAMCLFVSSSKCTEPTSVAVTLLKLDQQLADLRNKRRRLSVVSEIKK